MTTFLFLHSFPFVFHSFICSLPHRCTLLPSLFPYPFFFFPFPMVLSSPQPFLSCLFLSFLTPLLFSAPYYSLLPHPSCSSHNRESIWRCCSTKREHWRRSGSVLPVLYIHNEKNQPRPTCSHFTPLCLIHPPSFVSSCILSSVCRLFILHISVHNFLMQWLRVIEWPTVLLQHGKSPHWTTYQLKGWNYH